MDHILDNYKYYDEKLASHSKEWLAMNILNKLVIAILVGSYITGFAAATPVIDGNLDEWGLSKLVTNDWKFNETWLPDPVSSSIANEVQFVIEDNRDPRWGNPDGVHIRGMTSNYVRFYEPLVQFEYDNSWRPEPVGGETNDLEAVYLYQDANDIYIAIVTSVSPTGTGGLQPGDLAFNLDNDLTTGEYGYEYGVIISPNSQYPQGSVLYYPHWEGTGAIIPENPDIIIKPEFPMTSVMGNAEIIYSNSWMNVLDNTYDPKPNWVVEMRIPKTAMGLTGNVQMGNIWYADNCLNDHIFIPEFPTFAVLIGMVFGLIGTIYFVKSRK
jgi:hypothetical protein